jgi:putative ABC transport system permease protein
MLPSALRFAVRRWRHRPALALIATLVLALGIGATTAMFSIVNGVLLKDEPWPDADALVRIYAVQPHQRANPAYAGRWDRMPISWQSWRDLQRSQAFADVAVWATGQQIVGDDRTELVQAFHASSTLPALVGATPALGRFFTADEDEADSGTVILSHRLWTRLFGADSGVIGRVTSVTLPGGSVARKDNRRTIVGVLPEGFSLPGETPDLLIPIGFHKYNGSYGNAFFVALGRLAPGGSVSAAAAAAEPLVRRDETTDRRAARVVTVRVDRLGIGDRSLWLLLAGAALLLVVACSNVAGLLLSDARSRHHETAIRLALGGSRASVFRQLLAEHAMLAIAAGAAGLGLAMWLLPSLTALAPPGLIGQQAIVIDRQIAFWSILAAVVTTMVAGLIPAVAMSSTRPGDALKTGSREMTRGSRWRHRLVVSTQFAIATVLLVGAGLFVETLVRLGNEPLGFATGGIAAASVVMPRAPAGGFYTPEELAKAKELMKTDVAAWRTFVQEQMWVRTQSLLDRVAAMPGVRAVAAVDALPFSATTPRILQLRPEGSSAQDTQSVRIYLVSKEYFDVMGIRRLAGQTHSTSMSRMGSRLLPGEKSRRPVVVSETLARRAFGGQAVGRTLVQANAMYDVIGVVADVKQSGLLDRETAAMYLPFGTTQQVRHIVVRAEGSAGALLPDLRRAIETHDAPMFVDSTSELADRVAFTIVIERGRALLSSVYGGVALFLAGVGLYGLAARLVAERRREIGIRIALGAGPKAVRRLVMTDAGLIVGLGLAAGVPAAIGAMQLAQGLVYGVAPATPQLMAAVLGALTLVGVTATIVPAWRASRVDPAVTLREE